MYIPVVNVETLKIDTVPKSDKHSIATKAKPAIIAGLAEGSIIFKKFPFQINLDFDLLLYSCLIEKKGRPS